MILEPVASSLLDVRGALELMPTLVLSPGSVVISDKARYFAALDALLLGAAPQVSTMPALTAMLHEVLEKRWTGEWNVLVTVWDGTELEIGETRAFDMPFSVDSLGASSEMTTQMTVLGLARCHDKATKAECLRIDINGKGNKGKTTEMMKTMLAALPGGKAPDDVEFQILNLVTHASVVFEPDGLIPHYAAMSRDFSLRVVENGKITQGTQTDKVVRKFHYPPH